MMRDAKMDCSASDGCTSLAPQWQAAAVRCGLLERRAVADERRLEALVIES